ncbi:MAG: multicopper oxidase domain-containing protein [Candidatus Krumholzibacteriia bacterium]
MKVATFHRWGLATGAIVLALSMLVAPPAPAQALLDPADHPKFDNPLPVPARIDATGGGRYNGFMRETEQWLGLVSSEGDPLLTTVWGYMVPHASGPPPQAGDRGRPGERPSPPSVTYPGPTFVAMRDTPVEVRWHNQLPHYNRDFPGLGGHLLPVDPTLHLAHPVKGGIPTVTHLHGGHSESASDGLPEAWFTQGWRETGPEFVKRTYRYDNSQEAATLWYHDHALGITRLNVYAGLAGFYLLRDENELQLTGSHVLPGGPYEIEVVVQDRMFTSDGELFYPSTDPEIEPGFDPLPPVPSAIAEFFGDFILVNATAWPVLEVEPRKYRFRLLNGSDSRFYVIELRDDRFDGAAQEFLQIGTDTGLLPTPVALDRLLIAPGERMDLVIDFASFSPGTELYLRNFGPDDPLKGFNPDGSLSDGEGGTLPPADPQTTGQLMKFAVTLPLDPDVPDATVDTGTMLRPPIAPLQRDGAIRQLALFEGLDQYGRLQPLLGTLEEGSLAWFAPITENPMLNDVEVWEVYNATEDAHPIHVHLVSFQIIDRESFEGFVEEKPQPQHDGTFGVGGVLQVTALGGDARPPADNEAGWKDTAVMLPGEVTRIVARFDRPGRYVWHCHILSHEDHEMMRPFYVGPMPAVDLMARNDASPDPVPLLAQNTPNPFNPSTNISFRLPTARAVDLRIFDVRGRTVHTLADGDFAAGEHTLSWQGLDDAGRRLPSGVYFYQLRAGDILEKRKMIMVQ